MTDNKRSSSKLKQRFQYVAHVNSKHTYKVTKNRDNRFDSCCLSINNAWWQQTRRKIMSTETKTAMNRVYDTLNINTCSSEVDECMAEVMAILKG
jgi:hypothetical protein